MKLLTTFIFSGIILYISAQNIATDIQFAEDSLIHLLQIARNQPDEHSKKIANKDFKNTLKFVLTRNTKAPDYPFEKLKKKMAILDSPDGVFRIYNWNIELNKYGEHQYYCIVSKNDKKRDKRYLIDCVDKSKYARTPEYTQFTEKKWYGALYYDIIPVKRGTRTIYTLLAWDGNDMSSNKKIIETMKFSGNTKLKFGDPIFKMDDDKIKRRVIFQYKKDTYMSLKHKTIKKQEYIIFDHLSPTSPELEGIKDWYVTDLSFDAFVWDKNKWVYQKDVDMRLDKKFKTKYNNPLEK